ncbi:MAG TPA: hypothetical protein VNP72_00480 [Longimicrobium sp.]|nr:hypothetical protein [Longimicrobium sp.]
MSTQAAPAHEHIGPSPQSMLDEWRKFVQQCQDGYPFNIYEYHNDLSVRDRIEACLHETAADADAQAGFAAGVAEEDERFRALLQPGVQVGPEEDAWWHRGVLRYAWRDLARDLKDWFNVEIEVRE